MVASSKIACIVIAAGVMLGGVMLGGCGYRGPIQMAKEDAAAQTTAPAESGQGKPEGAAPKPHKGFILDGLLR